MTVYTNDTLHYARVIKLTHPIAENHRLDEETGVHDIARREDTST